MKGCCAIFLLMVCVFAHAARLPDSCSYEDETLSVGEHIRQCLRITCHANGNISALGCPLVQCLEEKQIGYQKMDNSKPYPECCERPICKE
ncbi:uncharacterized protein [Anoplolepis gracilipes]|uniref:uncharacterized protein n=1 Tax=Anoplolepis gracilipes TaxID=354296 RepID=UPI003B9EEBA0